VLQRLPKGGDFPILARDFIFEFFPKGTNSSNPLSSSDESANSRSQRDQRELGYAIAWFAEAISCSSPRRGLDGTRRRFLLAG
jgi:hypothetical protein